MTDHYETLGVPRDASPDDIKRAKQRKASEHHPDRNPDDPKAHEQMAKVNRAYDVLSDPTRRQAYDERGEEDVESDEVLVAKLTAFAFRVVLDHMEMQRGNVLTTAREFLQSKLSEIVDNLATANSFIEKMNRMRGKVKRKRGTNLYDEIIESRVKGAQLQAAQLKENLRLHELALRDLDTYESTEPPPAPAIPQTMVWATFGSYAGTGL